MANKEKFEDITEILRRRGERIKPGAKYIIASGGNYREKRRFWAYPMSGERLKLYPADAYTYSVTDSKHLPVISFYLIETVRPAPVPPPDPAEEARKKASAAAKEQKELRRVAKEREKAEQFSFLGGMAYEGI